MTQNQIAYQTLLETKRRNAADEVLRENELKIKQQQADNESWRSGFTIADAVGKGLSGLFTGLSGKEFTGGSGLGQLGSAIGSGLNNLWSSANFGPLGALGSGAVGTTIGMDIFQSIEDLIDGKTELIFKDKATGDTYKYVYDIWSQQWFDEAGNSVPNPYEDPKWGSGLFESWIEGISPDWSKPEGNDSQLSLPPNKFVNIFDVLTDATEDIFV